QKRPDDLVSLVEERITQAEDWEEKRQMMAQSLPVFPAYLRYFPQLRTCRYCLVLNEILLP
ncbi:hypothetical protein ACUOCP_56135, partial [Escherichia sp. R-CC3]